MPELPEVETVVRGLRQHLIGQKITRVDIVGHHIFRGKMVNYAKDVTGRIISRIDRHGKYILIGFKGQSNLLQIHLGMTGRLLWKKKSDPTENHTHLLFQISHKTHHLRYRDVRRFGWLEMVPSTRIQKWALDAWTTPESHLLSHFAQVRGFAKNTLMNQAVLSGLGNIYVDESLHRAKIHPRTRLENLSINRRSALVHAIKEVLSESISVGGSSVFNYVDVYGGQGGFKQRLKVYGKAGEACECGSLIKKMTIVGRSTHFCARCQRKTNKL